MQTPEGKIKDMVKKFLHDRKVQSLVDSIADAVGFYWMPVPSGYGSPFVDFVICYRGRFIAVETKCDRAIGLTARQELILEMVTEGGGRVIWGGEDVILSLEAQFNTIDRQRCGLE
jgi:hypothetical protein